MDRASSTDTRDSPGLWGHMGARSLSPDTYSLKRPWQPLASLVLHIHRDVTPNLPEGHL